MLVDVPNKLFTTFNNVKYYDEPHKYYVGKNQLKSVTTILGEYKEEFDEKYWSEIKANQFGLTVREILRAWRFVNKKGTMKGSIIHDYTENKFLNKIFPYPKQLILDEFGFDPILPEYLITKKHVDNFYNDTLNKLIPIRTEMVIHDDESLIGGMADMLFWNVKAQEYQIWDWKTNKEFTFKTNRRLKNQLFILDDSDISIYSLQLSIYKYIIEKHTGIKLGKSYLVWFSHNNPNYEVIKCHDWEYYAKTIIDGRILELGLN